MVGTIGSSEVTGDSVVGIEGSVDVEACSVVGT